MHKQTVTKLGFQKKFCSQSDYDEVYNMITE